MTEATRQRLAKRIAAAGVASRRDAEKLIEAGRISVNGKVVNTPAFTVTNADRVSLDGKLLPLPATQPRIFMLHKPDGVMCTARDPQGRKTVYDLIPKQLPRLIMVGRLDLNSEGLLLLTTDGELAQTLMLPRTGLEREYRVRFRGSMTPQVMSQMQSGIEIDGVTYKGMKVFPENSRDAANQWATVILTEGKNREVRRVFEYFGLTVNRLLRTRYGPFSLQNLPKGGLVELAEADVTRFVSSLRGKKA